jgi:hypothetical protein
MTSSILPLTRNQLRLKLKRSGLCVLCECVSGGEILLKKIVLVEHQEEFSITKSRNFEFMQENASKINQTDEA